MRRAVLLFCLLWSAVSVLAQDQKVDPKLHSDVLKLVEVDGIRDRLQGGMEQGFEDGKEQIVKHCPNCTDAFVKEWSKRMHQRLKVDDFVQVAVHVYEKYLTDDDVTKLIAFLKAKKENVQAAPPEELAKKLTAVGADMVTDITTGCTQIGAKIGAQVGEEIGKEHPEYLQGKRDAPKQ